MNSVERSFRFRWHGLYCFFNIRLATRNYIALILLFEHGWLSPLRAPPRVLSEHLRYGNFLFFLTRARRVLAQACWVTRNGTSQYYFKLVSTLSKNAHTSAFEFYLSCWISSGSCCGIRFLLSTEPSNTVLFQLHSHAFCSSLPGVTVFLLRLAGLPATVLLSIISSLFLLYQRIRMLPLSSSTCAAEFFWLLPRHPLSYLILHRHAWFYSNCAVMHGSMSA